MVGPKRKRPEPSTPRAPEELRQVELFPFVPDTPGAPVAPEVRAASGSPGSSAAAGTRAERGAADDLVARLGRIAAHSPTAERYTVIGEIGRGGMGRVLRVWDNDLQRELARKELAPKNSPSDSDAVRAERARVLERFIEEARLTSRLDHPGIVPVHEIAVDTGGTLYFTMPLVRGRDLARVFELVRARQEGWTLTRALGVLLKVCETVAFAHAKGVVHRDLKPSNVMVGLFGETYVMDWGLALVLGTGAGGGVVGTPAYMSPEQAGARPEDVGPASDVYSLGAILYELLTGRMPHADTGATAEAGELAALLGRPPRPVHELAPHVAAELAAICEKAMAFEPRARYADVGAMAEDLRAYLEGRVVQAYESGLLASLRKWVRRNRELSIALEALVVLGVLSTAVLVWQQISRFRALRAAHERTEQAQYASTLRAVELDVRVNETSDAKLRLAEARADHRGWEWEHLNRRTDTSVARIDGGAGMTAIAFHPNGASFIAGSESGWLRRWDARTRSPLGERWSGHTDEVWDVAFDPAGELLASSSSDATVRLWDADSGVCTAVLEAGGRAQRSLSFSEEGLLACGDLEGTLRIWDAPLAALVVELRRTGALASNTNPLEALPAFAPEWPLLAAAYSDGLVCLWDAERAEVVQSKRFEDGWTSLAVAPDGELLALGAIDGTVWILAADDLELVRSLRGHGKRVRDVGFGAAGRLLLSAAEDRTARVWEVAHGFELATFVGHDGEMHAADFDPAGELVASASSDGSVRLWRAGNDPAAVLRAHEDAVLALASGPDYFVTGSRDGTLALWNSRTGELLARHPVEEVVRCVALQPNGALLALAADGPEVQLLDPLTGEARGELHGHAGHVTGLAFGSDGARLLSRGDDKTLRLWDVEAREQLLELRDHDALLASIAFVPGEEGFAAGSGDGLVRLWDGRSDEPVAELVHEAAVTAVAFRSNGRLLACGMLENSIALWTRSKRGAWTRTGTLRGHDDFPTALVFSPDGARLVSCAADSSVRVWNPDTGHLLLTLHGHEDDVTGVAFSADGRDLVSISADATVRLWRGGAR